MFEILRNLFRIKKPEVPNEIIEILEDIDVNKTYTAETPERAHQIVLSMAMQGAPAYANEVMPGVWRIQRF